MTLHQAAAAAGELAAIAVFVGLPIWWVSEQHKRHQRNSTDDWDQRPVWRPDGDPDEITARYENDTGRVTWTIKDDPGRSGTTEYSSTHDD